MRLNSTTSIVDYLKSVNKPSDFSSRKSLYESSDLASRLGQYVGSSSQNIAFLKQLQNTPAAPVAAAQPVVPAPTAPIEPAKPAASAAQSPTAPVAQTAGVSGITAIQALASIPKAPSADELLGKVLEAPGFRTFQEKQELKTATDIGGAAAEKELLASTAKRDTQTFIDQMGKRGLFFSGETATGLEEIAQSLAASKLKVDRDLATKLLESDLDTREKIIGDVADLVKEAQGGRKEAISALEKVGLTVVGDQVVPTLAAQSAARSEAQLALSIQKEDRVAQAQAAQQELSDARFSYQQAKDAETLRISEARLALAEEAAGRAAASVSAGERQANAAVNLYQNDINAIVDAGLTPQDALTRANGVANNSGLILGVEEQNAILNYATQRVASRPKETVSPAPISDSFSGRLFFGTPVTSKTSTPAVIKK